MLQQFAQKLEKKSTLTMVIIDAIMKLLSNFYNLLGYTFYRDSCCLKYLRSTINLTWFC